MTLRIRPEARLEILQAARWYEEREAGLSAAFIAELDAAFMRLELGQEQYQVLHRNLRRALTRRFPYAIYFACEGADIIGVAVLHQSRDRKILNDR